MEIKHYLVILQRWWWILLLCTIQPILVTYWLVSSQPRVYESRARYLVGPVMDDPDVQINDLRSVSKVGRTYSELATSRPVLQSVIDKLQLNMDVNTLAENVEAAWTDTTQIVSIRARANDPGAAANIANAMGDALLERSPSGPSSPLATQRKEAMAQITRLKESIRTTETELDQITDEIQGTTDPVQQRGLTVRLDQRRAHLAAAQRALSDQYAIVQGSRTNQIAVMETAVPELEPIAPKVSTAVLVALIGGLVVGLVAMVLMEYFLDVIYTVDELRKVTGLTCLGTIARHRKLRGTGAAQFVVQARPDTVAAESYRVLRANLQRAGGEPIVPSLLITSAANGNGKSEIAANLAISFARAGKRTILIDANLRRPRSTTLFGLQNAVGLSSLLDRSDLRLEPVPVEFAPGLSVLPAGEAVPDTWDLLGSHHMQRLIHELKARADIVIIDSPSLQFADALALAQQVDGVLVVARSGKSVRANASRGIEALRQVGAHIVGTVMNGVKPGVAFTTPTPRLVRKQSSRPMARPVVAMADDMAAVNESRLDLIVTNTVPEVQYAAGYRTSSNGDNGHTWPVRSKNGN